MDTEKWAVLLQSIDTGSLSKVAKQMNYTTSGISRIIASLEKEVGFSLLIRNNRGVIPTRECQIMLPDIRNLVHTERLIQQQVSQINGLDIGSLTIGTAYSSSYPILTNRVVTFVKHYPNIKVNILWGFSAELRQAVMERRIDVCIVSKGNENFLWYPLQKERMMALVSSSHTLAKDSTFPIEAFATEPYIDIHPNQETDSAILLNRHRIKPNVQFTTSDRYAAHEMVEAGLGITLLNETQILDKRKGICVLPLNPPQSVEIGMICLPNSTLATKRFIDFMQEAT